MTAPRAYPLDVTGEAAWVLVRTVVQPPSDGDRGTGALVAVEDGRALVPVSFGDRAPGTAVDVAMVGRLVPELASRDVVTAPVRVPSGA